MVSVFMEYLSKWRNNESLDSNPFIIYWTYHVSGYNHFDGYEDETTLWSKMGKWKIAIPSILVVFIILSYLVPKRNHFLLIIATPYVVDSGKSIIESLQDPNSKLSKLNQMTDKALDKALMYFDENKNDKQNKN